MASGMNSTMLALAAVGAIGKKQETPWRIDESASTYIGSGSGSGSDSESVVSAASNASSALVGVATAGRARCNPAPLASRACRGRNEGRGCLTGMPLETIPGTPAGADNSFAAAAEWCLPGAVAVTRPSDTAAAAPSQSDAPQGVYGGGLVAMIPVPCVGFGTSLPCSGFGTVPTRPQVARERALAAARQAMVPVKVHQMDMLLDFGSAFPSAGFDPEIPVKKWPAFGDVPGGPEALAALRRLEPGLPVKRNMPKCLLEVESESWSGEGFGVGVGGVAACRMYGTPGDFAGVDVGCAAPLSARMPTIAAAAAR